MTNRYIKSTIDSSVRKYPKVCNLKGTVSSEIMFGLIVDEVYSEEIDEYLYFVAIQQGQESVIGVARQIQGFNDVYNFTEFRLRSNTDQSAEALEARLSTFTKSVGELAIVAAINGDFNDLVILGSLKNHPRKLKYQEKDPFFYSIYNGIETLINSDGEYELKFKGVPINEEKLLTHKDGTPVEEPEYNEDIGGSSFKMEKDGSIVFTDAHKEVLQIFKIDKSIGEFNFTSKETIFTINGAANSIFASCKDFNIESEETFDLKTDKCIFRAESTMKVSSPKIAIGNGNIELLDVLVKIIDEIGLLIIPGPSGPNSPVNAAPSWAGKVEDLKSKIKEIQGKL